MSTVILGAGFLGNYLAKALPDALLLRTDITNAAALRHEMSERRPQVIINTAGKTGRPNVDWCETHQLETYRSNVIGALTVAQVASEVGAHLVHIGSGCIFYGPAPHEDGWREDDHANPTSFYSRTKYSTDLVLSRMPAVCVVRIRMPIDSTPHPRNLITKLATYQKVVDVENSMTVLSDLVPVLAALIEKRAEGVFHATNPGTMRHRELLALYREYVDPKHTVEFIPEAQLVTSGLALKARSNNALSSARLADLGIRMRPIAEMLRETMMLYVRPRVVHEL